MCVLVWREMMMMTELKVICFGIVMVLVTKPLMFRIALSCKNLVAISFCSFSKKRVLWNCLHKCIKEIANMAIITNSTRIKSCSKNLLGNLSQYYSNCLIVKIINWNKLKLKKNNNNKYYNKKPRRWCDWLFFSSGRFSSQCIVNPVNRFLGTYIMIVSFLGSATCMLTQLNVLLK